MHKTMEPLKALVGKWEGVGKGSYPSVQSFDFKELLTVENLGQPNFHWNSISYIRNNAKHRECGFLRRKPDSSTVSLMLAENTGIVSNMQGEFSYTNTGLLVLKIKTESISATPFNKPPSVTAVERVISMTDAVTMTQNISMSTSTNAEMTLHIQVVYKKIE